tara:strand:- start:598 stop:792 length:195 start_codon:yes stop_codon:yes gene_type:complete
MDIIIIPIPIINKRLVSGGIRIPICKIKKDMAIETPIPIHHKRDKGSITTGVIKIYLESSYSSF